MNPALRQARELARRRLLDRLVIAPIDDLNVTPSSGQISALISRALSLARPESSHCVHRPIHVRRARNGSADTSSDRKKLGLIVRIRGIRQPSPVVGEARATRRFRRPRRIRPN
jgi:hypothetical protein